MKKTILGILLLAFSNAYADGTSVLNSIKAKFPNMPSIEKPVYIPEAKLYEVRLGDKIVYTNEAVDYVLVGGEVVVSHNNKAMNITSFKQAPQQAATGNDLSGVDLWTLMPFKNAFKTVYGDGKIKVAYFTDPDCPFCQQQEQDLQSRLAKGNLNMTVYTFLRPLPELHPNATAKAEYLLCSKDKAKTYASWMKFSYEKRDEIPNDWARWMTWLSKEGLPAENNCEPGRKAVQENMAAADKFGFTGTPTFYFDKVGVLTESVNLTDLLTIQKRILTNTVK